MSPVGPYVSLSRLRRAGNVRRQRSGGGRGSGAGAARLPRLLTRAKEAGYGGKREFLLWWTAREANCKRLGRGFTWSPLPEPEHCVQGTLEHAGGTYYYSVCW